MGITYTTKPRVNRPYPSRVMTIIGTRPEAIKMAPVVKTLQTDPRFQSVLCVSGQHLGLLERALEAFDIVPDVNMKVMQPGQSLTELTANILTGLAPILSRERPDRILVHGDTSTTLAASLAGFYAKIPVGHVEAGLRSNDISSPWPEEANRKMVATVATDHFAPTESARQSLLAEGVPDDKISVTGNTVIDALQAACQRLKCDAVLQIEMQKKFAYLGHGRRVLLVTMHRRENHGDGVARICKAVKNLTAAFPDLLVVLPMHRNPAVCGPVRKFLAGQPNIHLIEPLDYLPFVYLMTQSHLILTDSGGIQEEAPTLGVPVLVARDTTERSEAVDVGTVLMTGTSAAKIYQNAARLLQDQVAYSKMAQAHNPYGDGRASARIIEHLAKEMECEDWTQSRSLGWAI